MPGAHNIKRGDIYDVDWGGNAGLHPALVIQNDIGNTHSDYTIVAYITHTPSNGLPMLISFGDHESGLAYGSSVDLGRIMTIPQSMLKNKRGRLSSVKMPEINQALMISLGIEQ